MRELSRNGRSTTPGSWLDKGLVERVQQVGLAFVAGYPARWVFHCQMLSHQSAEMRGHIEVGWARLCEFSLVRPASGSRCASLGC